MKLFFIFLLGLLINTPSAQAQGRCLLLGVTDVGLERDVAEQVSHALNDAGVCNRIRLAPNKRLTALFQARRLDGEILRVVDYKHTVGRFAFMVTEPIAKAKGVLVFVDGHVKSLDDLKGQAIGIVRGTKWAEELLENNFQMIEVSTLAQLPEMLQKDRIAGFLINDVSWAHLVSQHAHFHKINVKDLSAHIWLLNEHRDLDDRISQVIKRLDLTSLTQ